MIYASMIAVYCVLTAGKPDSAPFLALGCIGVSILGTALYLKWPYPLIHEFMFAGAQGFVAVRLARKSPKTRLFNASSPQSLQYRMCDLIQKLPGKPPIEDASIRSFFKAPFTTISAWRGRIDLKDTKKWEVSGAGSDGKFRADAESIGAKGLAVLLVAFGIWNADNILCEEITGFRNSLPYWVGNGYAFFAAFMMSRLLTCSLHSTKADPRTCMVARPCCNWYQLGIYWDGRYVAGILQGKDIP